VVTGAQGGLVRVATARTAAQTGTARTRVARSATQGGLARVATVVSRAISGVSRIQGRPQAFQVGHTYIHVAPSLITSIEFITQPAGPTGAAFLLVWSTKANVAAAALPTSAPDYTANDEGAVIQLTAATAYIRADPVAVGTANVTVRVTQAGAAISGVLICTVTLVGGQLQAAWVAGSITPVSLHG
jgi:hypothetical protein